MNIKILTQPNLAPKGTFFLGEKLNELLKSKKPAYQKIYLVTSSINSAGIEKLNANIKKAIKNKANVSFILGVTNKQTTVEALKSILELGCECKVFRNLPGNNFGIELYFFESEQEAQVLTTAGSLTEEGLYKDSQIVTQITYDLENGDSEKYNDFKNSMQKIIEPSEDSAYTLTDELIKMLTDMGSISYEKLPESEASDIQEEIQEPEFEIEVEGFSIELPTGQLVEISMKADEDISQKIEEASTKKAKKTRSKKKEEAAEENSKVDSDIEIEVADDVDQFVSKELLEIDEEVNKSIESQHEDTSFIIDSVAIDIEQMLFEQNKSNKIVQNFDLDKKEKIKKSRNVAKKEPIDNQPEEKVEVVRNKKIIISSSINKNNISSVLNTFFIQINKLKGKGYSGEVKIPVAARDFAPEFWGFPKEYKLMPMGGKSDKKCKKWHTTCRIIDVLNPEKKIDEIDLYQEEGKTAFNFYSKVLAELNPEENDIIRIIKCASGDEAVYQCELIRKECREYDIWEQFCSQKVKGTERKYGFA